MRFHTDTGPLDAPIRRCIVAGWTGRNTAAVQHHIEELSALGVAPPSTTPLFYQVSASLLCQTDQIQVLGPDTSGEAEPLLVAHDGALYLGLASDHTDRALEATSVAASKQICAKVCAGALWPLAEVEGHLDDLILRAWIDEGAGWVPYQDGTLAHILPLSDLLARRPLADGMAMLCGTLGAQGGVRPARAFRAELHDPVKQRSLTLSYDITPLDIIA